FTLSHGSLVGKPMGRAASPAQAVALHCTGPECPEVDALVGRAAVQAEVQVLVVSVFYRVHYFLWHPHSKGQVSPHLPDHNGCTDRVGPVAVSAVLGAIGERCRQLVCLCMIHLLVHTLLEVLEDDLEGGGEHENALPICHPAHPSISRFQRTTLSKNMQKPCA
uniref:Uncharacterized protein n=1 Tax=Oncorhynchus kisutch TaxID=8019 RepID=A0A8C7MBM0_ONCKI